MTMSSRTVSAAAAFALLLALPFALGLAPTASADDAARAPELQRLLDRFDAAQESVRTLAADFTETTHSELFAEPMVAKGRFFMTKPDSIRWEYDRPEEMRFIIHSDQYTGYFPAQNRAEQRSIKRWSERIFRFIGLGQGTEELSKFYDFRLGTAAERAAEPGRADQVLLVLEPRKRRVKKRVEVVRFWLHESDWLPRRVEYIGTDGNRREIDFDTVRVNPDLAAGLYDVDLPEDVELSSGFSGLPGLSDPQD